MHCLQMQQRDRIKKAIEVIIQEKRDIIFSPEKIKSRIAPLYGKIADLEGRFLFFYKFIIQECYHTYLMLLYFFNIGITLSKGNASTVRPFFPFIVSAIKREFSKASSVASMAAINKGESSSLRNVFPFWKVSFALCKTRIDGSVENAII